MLEYLDTVDSDSDFILDDTDDTSEEEEENAPHATPQAAYSVSDSEEDGMDDEDYREILSPEQPLPFLSNSKNCLDLSICLLLILLLVFTSISSSQA
jgi:hypothetical protein